MRDRTEAAAASASLRLNGHPGFTTTSPVLTETILPFEITEAGLEFLTGKCQKRHNQTRMEITSPSFHVGKKGRVEAFQREGDGNRTLLVGRPLQAGPGAAVYSEKAQ